VLRATGKHFCAGASSDGDPRPASAGADPRALRQAKRAVNTTMDIQGQHYIRNRFAELMDASPRLELGRE
jgi:hypothetical protein